MRKLQTRLLMHPILISRPACGHRIKFPVRLLLVSAAVLVLLLSFSSTSCSTAAGFGDDLESVGEEIEEATY